MELVAVRRAAALFYFQLERTNPLKRPVANEITKRYSERYGFLKYPRTYEENTDLDNGIIFAMGKWNDLLIEEFRIYPNGILVATGESTDRAEEFFVDAMQVWSDVGLPFSRDLVTKTIRLSELVVKSDVDLLGLHENIQGLVATTFADQATGGATLGFFLGEVDARPAVRIERLVGVPLADMQFWAQAPLSTRQHMEFLEAFERVLL